MPKEKKDLKGRQRERQIKQQRSEESRQKRREVKIKKNSRKMSSSYFTLSPIIVRSSLIHPNLESHNFPSTHDLFFDNSMIR